MKWNKWNICWKPSSDDIETYRMNTERIKDIRVIAHRSSADRLLVAKLAGTVLPIARFATAMGDRHNKHTVVFDGVKNRVREYSS